MFGSKTFIILATKSVNQQVLVFMLFDGGVVFLVILNFQDKGGLIKVFHLASYSQYQAHIIVIFQGCQANTLSRVVCRQLKRC